jgi:hypothetical protein
VRPKGNGRHLFKSNFEVVSMNSGLTGPIVPPHGGQARVQVPCLRPLTSRRADADWGGSGD